MPVSLLKELFPSFSKRLIFGGFSKKMDFSNAALLDIFDFVYMNNKELYFFKINYAIAHCSEYILLWDSRDFYAPVFDFSRSTF